MDEKRNESSPEPVWPPDGMLQCPKDDCPRLFTSRAAMESHQMSYKNHALCIACNIQFATHEELFLHRLVSKRHHNCPICNRGFKSEDGRDFHIQTDHPEDQGLTCPGCPKTFTCGEDYMSHISSNACRSSAVMALNEHNTRRQKMERVLSEASQAKPSLSFCSDDDSYRDNGNDSDSLGLPRPRPSQLMRQDSGAFDEHLLPDGSYSPDVSSNFSPRFSSPLAAPASRSLDEEDSPIACPRLSNPPPFANLAISPDDLIAYDEDMDVGIWPSSPALFKTPDRKQLAMSPSSCSSRSLQEIVPDWNSEKHWNSQSKRYFCDCGFTTQYVKVFEQHVLMERSTSKHHCTHCGKGFPTVATLFKHIEIDHSKENSWEQGNRRVGQTPGYGSSAGRLLDMDGPMDIGELEFQVYDRPPTFAQNVPRYRAKMDYGLRSTKVPHGTYW
ncbi:hypothetical protein N7481_008127 [Penicillium waksmanii]|uniref:uncharacterized protein n=1 Tax=Penicillium waksmanii TaxID=69791 RepID=UPI0025496ABD|nr:uncharacterized protein N7481_008127 [Penicillium waksmanii]KAJ5980829.1 hypothetical protein N7481_008127 [Penicillium waksmanii]